MNYQNNSNSDISNKNILFETCEIMGVNIAVTDMDRSVKLICSNLDKWRGKYICVSNVHTTVLSKDDDSYRAIQNNAVMALPDGGPLSSVSRSMGHKDARRVAGPDLMRCILQDEKKSGYRHFFYGGTQEILDILKTVINERYPNAVNCGMYSPPFRPLSKQEEEATVRMINDAKPDFVWVGLGAPKQEIWMAENEDKINALMIGVGAAFDFEAGKIKRAPMWMQKCSLEWFYRLIQDPKRLFKRYIVTNTRFILWRIIHMT